MKSTRFLGPLALAVAALTAGGAIAIAKSTDCGDSSAVAAISLSVAGGLVAAGLLFAARRPRGAGRAAAAALGLAVLVPVVGALAVFAHGMGCTS